MPQLTQLRSFTCQTPTNSELILELSVLPHIEYLYLNVLSHDLPPCAPKCLSFPSLDFLYLGVDSSKIAKFMPYVSSTTLRYFNMLLGPCEDLEQIMTALALTHCALLFHFQIMRLRHWPPTLGISALWALLACHLLEPSIVHSRPLIGMSDQGVISMAEAWPNLQKFSMEIHPELTEDPIQVHPTPTATLDALCALDEKCPSLHHIHISIDGTDPHISGRPRVRFESPKVACLVLQSSTVCAESCISDFVDFVTGYVFPNLDVFMAIHLEGAVDMEWMGVVNRVMKRLRRRTHRLL
jgi:hypothetical protein